MTTSARVEENARVEADPAASIVRGLRTPLEALRASLESLGDHYEPSDPHLLVIRGALEELSLVSRGVDELVDYSSDTQPRPLRCTVEEILQSVRAQAPEAERERVLLARPASPRAIFVDGPLLVRSLDRLVRNALEASDESVLLFARQDELRTTFCVVNRGPQCRFDLEEADRAFVTEKPDHLGLGLTLAKRDIERMGGSLSAHVSSDGHTLVRALLPDAASPAPASALPSARDAQGGCAA